MAKLIIAIATFIVSHFTFSQEILSEDIDLKNGSIKLPGTLSYPKTDKAIPLAIFIHGSGNVDRNGNQSGIYNPGYIQQLADSLNKKGIAFYRYDKRTATLANLPTLMKGVNIKDFVEDAVLATNNFKDDHRFNSITLIGHSQGSLIAMLAAQECKVDKYISVAGPAAKIETTLERQLSQRNDSLSIILKAHFKELMETDTIAKVDPNLMSIFAPQNQKFFKSWNTYNPVEEIAKLKIPVLILQGSSDLQVTEQDAQALHKQNTTSILKVIPKMNHPLKIVENMQENQQSYSNPDFPLSSLLVSTISEFIKE
ncbi:alpha/beta hydrolase [Neptunitalea lumnitzerae]|uniref:Alpha/beta hydrolase n=1 Tax=Neptunitalea lumnitzerae TaxID=2965509 RepID=A0ABQ5MI06_9FLAO|nr:alpha/beta hydrolase [Neptunitalea sp. Y10]GLB48941.1 alpha/beta hydrolase [Neptunitalea sp. Y10]